MGTVQPRLVDPQWVHDRLDDPSIRLVDATVHLTFDEDGAHRESGLETYRESHLPGATFAGQIDELSLHDGEAPFEASCVRSRTARCASTARR